MYIKMICNRHMRSGAGPIATGHFCNCNKWSEEIQNYKLASFCIFQQKLTEFNIPLVQFKISN